MPPDAALEDLVRWDEPDPRLPDLPPPFVSIGTAVQRVMRAAGEARLQRQIREIFGDG